MSRRPDGGAVLDQVRALLIRYCVLPTPEAYDAVVLWVAATHALPALPAATRLVITAPVKRAGKTRLLDVIEGLCYSPLITMNATVPAIFRSLTAEHPPTLIFDEVDTIFGSARVAEANEDLRGLLNAGFQRGKPTLRCVGPMQTPTQFQTFSMVAMAGIGNVPDTIRDRAVNIRMRRRKQDETVSPFRDRRDRPQLEAARDRLTEWLGDTSSREVLVDAEPTSDLEDRAADVWEPLLMVADLAGSEWPSRARQAAKVFTSDGDDEQDDSEDVLLLSDLREVYSNLRGDWIATEVLLHRLHMIDESPWGSTLPVLNAHRLGRLLRGFGVRSARDPKGQKRGYNRHDFADAWERYPERRDRE